MAFLGGQFVLIGSDLYTSPEGRTWTYRTADNEFWADSIAYGNGTFFAPTDYRGFISTGQNLWTLNNVTGPGKLVAFGKGVFVSPWGGHFATSTDATNWTAAGSIAINPNAITFAMGMFVTVGNSGVILTSPDGVNWRPRNSGVTNNLQAVAFAGSSFMAVGDGGLILQSGPIFNLLGRKSPGGFELQLTGEVGRSYRLQVSSDLRNWSDYVGFTSTQPTTSLLDPSGGQSLTRFYRAVSP